VPASVPDPAQRPPPLDEPRLAVYGFTSDPGGIGKVMLNLVNAAATRLPVDLLIARRAGPDLLRLSPAVRLMELGDASLLALARYLRETRPAALLTNKEWANRQAVLARDLARVPTRIAFRVGTNLGAQLVRRHALKRSIRLLAMRLSYRRADRIIANAEGVAEDIVRFTGVDPARVVVCPNPTLPEDFAALSERPVDHPWLVSRGPPVLVAVGRLVRAKDYPTLLRAMARLRERHDCRLIVLGEGGERAAMERLAQALDLRAAVDLPGHDDDPYRYMRAADLFVLSSAWEGFPNVLVEALAAGLPIVATDCAHGPREILQGGRYGTLVPVGDDRALAEAIARTLLAPRDPARQRQAVERYRAGEATRAYLRVLLDLDGR